MAFWQESPRGANMFSGNSAVDIEAARSYGIRLIRIGATGSPGDLRYLVKGTKPNESWDLSDENIARLRDTIRRLNTQKINVVITLAHIPGRTWEHRKRDYRIWHNDQYQRDFVAAWKTIASALSKTAGVIGYDIFNEPYLPTKNPEKTKSLLWSLYKQTIQAIREVDADTPVIVESPAMAAASEFSTMPVFSDEKVIYSFHYYEPFPYFSPPLNRGRFIYPGMIPNSEEDVPLLWSKETHLARLRPVRDWQIRNGIEAHKIFVGEFGIWRKAKGAEQYLKDLVDIFDQYGWSWSYYAFREDDWDVADLELTEANSARQETTLFKILKAKFK